jgi:hypothetical protein
MERNVEVKFKTEKGRRTAIKTHISNKAKKVLKINK